MKGLLTPRLQALFIAPGEARSTLPFGRSRIDDGLDFAHAVVRDV